MANACIRLTILHVIKISSIVSVLFREVFSHPYITFFHLLVHGFSVVRECGSTLYAGLTDSGGSL